MSDEDDDGEAPQEILRVLAEMIEEGLNGRAVDASQRELGFTLFVFPYALSDGNGGMISNCTDRSYVLSVVRAMLNKLEAEQMEEFETGGESIN